MLFSSLLVSSWTGRIVVLTTLAAAAGGGYYAWKSLSSTDTADNKLHLFDPTYEYTAQELHQMSYEAYWKLQERMGPECLERRRTFFLKKDHAVDQDNVISDEEALFDYCHTA